MSLQSVWKRIRSVSHSPEKFEDEDEIEDDYDWGTKTIIRGSRREKLVLVGSLLLVRSRSRIVIVLGLVLEYAIACRVQDLGERYFTKLSS